MARYLPNVGKTFQWLIPVGFDTYLKSIIDISNERLGCGLFFALLPFSFGFMIVSAAMEFVEKARIMDGARINRALSRLASEIVEENQGSDDLYLVGIRRRGVPLA